ncbi:hypothetical protein V8J88_01120 [Massilia sp. W12]|uniref:hypothetical protein n=1 Tax=Massilia sp. W12 TaxID=3126507 RepID=UPI0030CD6F91
MDIVLTLLKLLAALAGMYYTIKIFRDAQARHPVFDYTGHSQANDAAWRWRKPDAELGLRLEDDAQKSILHIPVNFLFFEKICMLAGAACTLLTLYLYGLFVWRNSGVGEYLMGLIFVFLSIALLHVGSRVSALILYPDHLVVVVRYAWFLQHRYIYQRHQKLAFSGKSESPLELTVDHAAPDYKLFILRRRPLFFSSRQRFILSLNQSQGSWLAAGLQSWHAQAVEPAP